VRKTSWVRFAAAGLLPGDQRRRGHRTVPALAAASYPSRLAGALAATACLRVPEPYRLALCWSSRGPAVVGGRSVIALARVRNHFAAPPMPS